MPRGNLVFSFANPRSRPNIYFQSDFAKIKPLEQLRSLEYHTHRHIDWRFFYRPLELWFELVRQTYRLTINLLSVLVKIAARGYLGGLSLLRSEVHCVGPV